MLLADVALHAVAVTSTGYWNSPFVFCLLTGVIAAGFARGFNFAINVAVAASLAVGVPFYVHYHRRPGFDLQSTAQWGIELVLVAIVAGYTRRLFGEAERRHFLALDRVSRLTEANSLLFALHRIAQALPASLDLDEALNSTLDQLRDLVSFDVAAVLLRDESTGGLVPGITHGFKLAPTLEQDRLPPAVLSASLRSHPTSVPNLALGGGPGLGLLTFSAIYAPLRARGTPVGLIAVEHRDVGHFTSRDVEVLEGFVEPAALAIDNARWFSRLRTIGADEERTRIARDLHDRLGQSLAYLAFELDRILKRPGTESAIHQDLERLRKDVRGVVTEMRETLYDLRTDVSEQQGLVETVESFLSRVEARAALKANFRHHSTRRLPLPQERELWRIAQEAITNVERHAEAIHLSVTWHCDGKGALLSVLDDGRGFPERRAGRMDSYGIIGMRERADAIGARLEIDSTPGQGTAVRCRLGE